MTLDLSRRGFLADILAAGAAPAIVSSGLIMPIKPALVVVDEMAGYDLKRAIRRYLDRAANPPLLSVEQMQVAFSLQPGSVNTTGGIFMHPDLAEIYAQRRKAEQAERRDQIYSGPWA